MKTNPQTRDVCQIKVARQIAMAQGQIWDRLNSKQQVMHLTIAQNIIATVERSMVDYEW